MGNDYKLKLDGLEQKCMELEEHLFEKNQLLQQKCAELEVSLKNKEVQLADVKHELEAKEELIVSEISHKEKRVTRLQEVLGQEKNKE